MRSVMDAVRDDVAEILDCGVLRETYVKVKRRVDRCTLIDIEEKLFHPITEPIFEKIEINLDTERRVAKLEKEIAKLEEERSPYIVGWPR